MKFWLESLQQNGFDVFSLVYTAILFIIYHYLMRWYMNNKFKELKQLIKKKIGHPSYFFIHLNTLVYLPIAFVTF